MTPKKTFCQKAAELSIPFGIAVALLAISAPLSAQDTIVEGKQQRSKYVEVHVDFADLDLRQRGSQQVLISRVRQASGRVCDIVYKGVSPYRRFSERCEQRSYNDTKPQIDLAIANAQNGKHLAMTFVVAAGR